jgi:hypothetical protein
LSNFGYKALFQRVRRNFSLRRWEREDCRAALEEQLAPGAMHNVIGTAALAESIPARHHRRYLNAGIVHGKYCNIDKAGKSGCACCGHAKCGV